MEYFPPVIFEVKAKATDAIAQFGAINKQLDIMATKSTMAQKSLVAMGVGFKYLRTAVLGVAAAYGALAVSGLKEIQQEEVALANLRIATENAGVAFQTAKPFFDQAAQSMIKLGFADEEAYAAMAKMTAATNSPKIALEQLATAADLARFSNVSLSEAGTAIAKASVGATRAFMELGLRMGLTIPKTATFAEIMTLVKEKVDGAAVAFGDTLAGKVAIANANFDELRQKVGEQILPYVIRFTDWITTTGIPKLTQLAEWVSRNKTALVNFGMAIAGIWAGTKIAAGIVLITEALVALRAAAITAGLALAFATGGTSVIGAVSALATIGLVGLTTKRLMDIITGKEGVSASGVPVYPSGVNPNLLTTSGVYGKPDLSGKGIKTTPTPKPAPTKSATTVQNITVYASDTNDISRKLSKAAKNGVPLGGK